MRAIEVRVGDRFIADITRLEPELVTFVDRTATSVTLVVGNVRYTFAPFEDVVFPRRVSGALFDWRTIPSPPTIGDLALGDTLPAVDGTTDGDDEGFMGTPPQMVTSIRCIQNQAGVPVFYLTCSYFDPEREKRNTVTYSFTFGEPIQFPRFKTAIPQIRHTEGSGELEWFGPYTHQVTGATFMFSKHPYGRGRWPSWVKIFDPTLPPTADGQPHYCRFPARDWDPDLNPSDPKLPRGVVARGPRRKSDEWTFQ